MMRCSLIRSIDRPLSGKPFGRPARWILRMVCGAVRDSNLIEPPVSVSCNRDDCKHSAPPAPQRVRPPLEW